MPTIREYRVVLPMTVEEFRVGREWHKLEKAKVDLKMREEQLVDPVKERIVLREPMYEFPFIGGTFEVQDHGEHVVKEFGTRPIRTNIISQAFESFGAFLGVILTGAVPVTDIESWEGHPMYRSVNRNQLLGNHYEMIIECYFEEGCGQLKNAFNLPPPLLKDRKIVSIDIASHVPTNDYRDGKNPMLFRSSKTGRGPLEPGKWMETQDPVMTCYILISIKFLSGWLGGYVERKVQNAIQRSLISYHRELYCLIDKWIDFTLQDIAYAKIQVEGIGGTPQKPGPRIPAVPEAELPEPKEDLGLSEDESANDDPPSKEKINSNCSPDLTCKSSGPSVANFCTTCPAELAKSCWRNICGVEQDQSQCFRSGFMLVAITGLAVAICAMFVACQYHLY